MRYDRKNQPSEIVSWCEYMVGGKEFLVEVFPKKMGSFQAMASNEHGNKVQKLATNTQFFESKDLATDAVKQELERLYGA